MGIRQIPGRIIEGGIKIALHCKEQIQQKGLSFYRRFQKKKDGLNLIGYFSYTFGVAEVGRFFALHMKRNNIPFSIYEIEAPSHNRLDAVSLKTYQTHFVTNPQFHKNIFFVNADQISSQKKKSPELFVARYNIGVFFWEFDDYFNFPQAFEVVNEVIAFTDFIATAVRKAAPANIKVTKLPFPFTQNWEITANPAAVRRQFNIAVDEFVFIFNFDFQSVYERKNPEAILKAFELAFTLQDNVRLIMKAIHAETSAESYSRFQSVIDNMQLKAKVILISDNLSRNEFINLINASDCYVSLHRSEGLGLGMLEAMSIAKPVIGTNYGGNTDFMRADNSLLVNYKLVPVKEGAGPYKAGWLWADADVDEAAAHMSKLYKNPEFCKDIGRRAKQSVQDQYGNDIFKRTLDNWMKS